MDIEDDEEFFLDNKGYNPEASEIPFPRKDSITKFDSDKGASINNIIFEGVLQNITIFQLWSKLDDYGTIQIVSRREFKGGPNEMILVPLDSSHRDKLNSSKTIQIGSLVPSTPAKKKKKKNKSALSISQIADIHYPHHYYNHKSCKDGIWNTNNNKEWQWSKEVGGIIILPL
ncbi:hypothetical protein F8M41_006935 [Gigaspora margarita]|uniref:Uncharacterized protein n=1 Tax=Gigaspora margarita TaxID=4874 RepID=A0A8H4ERD4_GIGMA|nr:hypothetical protein F8M41_006935 [Gigaspora margarita]